MKVVNFALQTRGKIINWKGEGNNFISEKYHTGTDIEIEWKDLPKDHPLWADVRDRGQFISLYYLQSALSLPDVLETQYLRLSGRIEDLFAARSDSSASHEIG